ncbi:transporter substrate-binding domain-containing protein [Cryobacterium frigoriphilum]|uniref:Transporter substrate-binding domain-containing protein n=1 Tax=Cryobacterium frigoriphilum TaxID=1259150 RepID=A0A4R8ZV59_9MICO|nr:transporter substrate-binding domain-containing protein [Cryobacterium frigoriphilum]TFD46911.1 transporter substrate-binding domain-containing protein [Cryobacterium frigoriphilum]
MKLTLEIVHMRRLNPKLVLIPVLAGALLLTGCTSPGNSAGGASASGSQLDKVIESGTVRVAVLPDYPPWSVQTPDGDFEGYDIDIAEKLAEALGVELELVSTDGTSRLPLLTSDRVDVNISEWTATDERAKEAGFTIPYVAHGAGVLFNVDNPIASFDELAGKTVSVARGSTNDSIMTKNFPDTSVERFETIADAMAALQAGKVDALVEGDSTVAQMAEDDPSYSVVEGPSLFPALVSMGTLKEDQVWINYLNNFIRNLNASGTNQELFQKWGNADLPDIVG